VARGYGGEADVQAVSGYLPSWQQNFAVKEPCPAMKTGLSMSEEQMKDPWSEIQINPKNLNPEDIARIILEPPLHPVRIEPKSKTLRKGSR
jgi:hypothetical protein